MKTYDELRRETMEAISIFNHIYQGRTEVDEELLEEPITIEDYYGYAKED